MFRPSESVRCFWARFRSGCLLFLLACLGALGFANAQAKPLSVVLIPGDPTTMTALAAVKRLQPEPSFKNVRFHVLPTTRMTEAHVDVLARADVAIVNNMGRELNERIAPAIQIMAKRGAKAFAVGSPYGESEKNSGLAADDTLRAYAKAGGADNWVGLIKAVLARDFRYKLETSPPVPFPENGIWDPRTGRTYDSFEDFAAQRYAQQPESAGRLWIGLTFNRVTAQSGQSGLLLSMVDALEAKGFNVLPVFGFPPDVPVKRYLMNSRGTPHVAAVVGLSLKNGTIPERIIPVLKQLDVPVLNAILLYSQSYQEWVDSPLGLGLMERSWQIAGAEFGGAIAPTVVASKEVRQDKDTGLEFIEEVAIPERMTRLADRIAKWVSLRYELNAHKRVAIVYYNYPPGKENIGASYLNVMPSSLWQILARLEREGYATAGRPDSEEALFERLREHGVNVGTYTPGALEKLVRSGNAMLLPVSDYRKWFDQQPKKLRDEMIQAWGEPEQSKIMVWNDGKGKPHFVFPAQRFGNLVFAPQPARGWGDDLKKMYHDVSLPLHHQYLAFYLWLQKGFKAHAMVHVGTHGTHEWQSGKEVGYTNADPGEALVADVPQLYPYIVDDVGEALQAKRRGMATIISHMTPPFNKASLNQELVLLKGLLNDYGVAAQKSESASLAKLDEINAKAIPLGVLKDIGKDAIRTAEDVEVLEHYLKDLSERTAPYGLHTFGVAPPKSYRLSTAEAILGVESSLTPEVRARRMAELDRIIELSAAAELDALVAGLSGRYVAAGPGNDPIRNPDSLPTGRNVYGFDPARMPTPGTWEQGRKLADKFVADYKARHGQYPDRVVFNLWSVEAMRHEGVTEAEIMALFGVRPLWDERGRTTGVEAIPRKELGRPRVDVTIVPSGLYRDSQPNMMKLLDDAVTAVKDLVEDDNVVRANVARTKSVLQEKGLPEEEATRMAAVRIFGLPPGAYGSNIEAVALASNTWTNESEVADVYFNRMGHFYGQGYYGDRPRSRELAVDIFKLALKDAKATIHARSSNLYGTLDNDDVYQWLGATSMAVRQVNGRAPETLILNLADTKAGRHETLDAFMGRELRTRYTNPEWVKAMLKEGYAGARFVKQVTENLWGWQVTVPEAVDGAKWNEMYETYVADRNQLGVKEMFRAAKNLLAYQAVVDRMLVAINKGYWKADPQVKAALEQVNREVIAEAGVACDETSCSSKDVTEMARAEDRKALSEALAMPAPDLGRQSALAAKNSAHQAQSASAPPSAAPASSPDVLANTPPPKAAARPTAKAAAPQDPTRQVEGFEVREQLKRLADLPPVARYSALSGFAALVFGGFVLRSRRRGRRSRLLLGVRSAS